MPHNLYRRGADNVSEYSCNSDDERVIFIHPHRRSAPSVEHQITHLKRNPHQEQHNPLIIASNPSCSSTTNQVTAETLLCTPLTNLTSSSRHHPLYVEVIDDRHPPQPQSTPWVIVSNTGSRSHSPHSHHCCNSRRGSWSSTGPHIPPRGEEEEFILAKDKLKRDHEEELKKQAIRDSELKKSKDQQDKEQIIKQARLEEHDKEEKKKAEEKVLRAKLEAEALAKAKAEDDAKKKKKEEIEAGVRSYMVKAGYTMSLLKTCLMGKGHSTATNITDDIHALFAVQGGFGHKRHNSSSCCEIL
jgi:hypothetical protein